jgi:hypothetical protein
LIDKPGIRAEMKAAIFNALLGTLLSLAAGLEILHLDWPTILLCVFTSNLSLFVALLGSLQIEKLAWFKKIPLHGAIKTWTVLTLLYVGLAVSLSAPLQNSKNFLVLVLPLILSAGVGILLFGPVQDQLVRRQQRKELTFKKRTNPQRA